MHLEPKSGMHVLSVAMSQVVIGLQVWQETVPLAVVNLSGGHPSQLVFSADPAYVPGAHGMQALSPALGPYFP
jgi:hypothetical protein